MPLGERAWDAVTDPDGVDIWLPDAVGLGLCVWDELADCEAEPVSEGVTEGVRVCVRV